MTLDETSRHLLRNYQAPASVGSSQAVTAVTLTNDTETEDNLNAVAHRLRGQLPYSDDCDDADSYSYAFADEVTSGAMLKCGDPNCECF